jgi:hypothetical protein
VGHGHTTQCARMLLGGQYFCIIKVNKENSRSVCYKQDISGSTTQKQTKYLLLTEFSVLIVELEIRFIKRVKIICT